MNASIADKPQSAPEMIPSFPPRWAEIFGEDRRGIFAEFTLNKVKFAWRWIPPGRFQMGSPDSEAGRDSDEGPVHSVTISRGFWLTETPITQSQWIAVKGENPSHFKGDQRPVESVSWHTSMAFAATLNTQRPGLLTSLPTEAQWEYACRAGTRGAFHVDGSQCTEPTGKDLVLGPLGWFEKNSGGETHDVKQKAANAWGLHDMHGNVWEWCRDGKRTYTARSERDPQGSIDESASRVVRGGSWYFQARGCRAACRFGDGGPGRGWYGYGLRLSAGQEPRSAARTEAERPSVPERRSRG